MPWFRILPTDDYGLSTPLLALLSIMILLSHKLGLGKSAIKTYFQRLTFISGK